MKLNTLSSLGAIALILGCQVEAQTYDTNNPVVQIFAGSGVASYLDGQGTQAMFNNPSKVVADSSSNLFVLDSSNSRIRKSHPTPRCQLLWAVEAEACLAQERVFRCPVFSSVRW